MIKFFRKIRQNLLNKNKVGKYLLYAFGEIILVIIGILIALNINQRSEQKKEEAKIDAIFEEVLVELEDFINKGENLIYFYRRKDSLASIIFNTELTYDGYTDEKNDALWEIPLRKSGLEIDDYAYKALMLHIDAIPERYDNVVRVLNALYNSMYANVDEYTKKVDNMVYENNEEIAKNYEWFSDPNEKNNGAITYRLNDFKFKNKVKRYRDQNFNHWHLTNHARQNAIVVYEEIAELLNKDITSKAFILNYTVIQKKVGTYIDDDNPNSHVKLFLEKDNLIMHELNSNRISGILYLGNQQEFTLYRRRAIARFHESELDNSIKMTIYEGHEATTYTKVNSDN
jgi:hypothetical protein